MEYNSEKLRFKKGKPFFIHYREKKLMKEWALEYHDGLEVFFLVEGKCNFFIDDKMYELRPGDIALIPPGVLHKVFYDQTLPSTRYMISCDTELLPKRTGEVLLSLGCYVERIPKSLGDIEELFFKISKEQHNPDILSEELIHGYMTNLAAFILRAGETRKSTDMKSSNSVIEAAIAYLKNNYSDNISIEDAARHVSLSAEHLSRTFKSETGLGIKEYLTMYRLKQASFMLTEYPSKSISKIAYDCGFNDSNYFASCFKKTVGVTPTEFRKGLIIKKK